MAQFCSIRRFLLIALLLGSVTSASAAFKFMNCAGGSKPWDNTTAIWGADAGGPYNLLWQDGDEAFFEGTAGTVTVGVAGVRVTSMSFLVAGYNIVGGTITLGTPAVAITTQSGIQVIAAPLAGDNCGLSKTGAGILELSGVNTFTGPANVDMGILRVASSGAMNGASGIFLTNNTVTGGTGTLLELSGDVTLDKPITMNSEGSFRTSIRSPSGANTIKGTITLIGSSAKQCYVEAGTFFVDSNFVEGAAGFSGSFGFRGNGGEGVLRGKYNLPSATFIKTDGGCTWSVGSSGNIAAGSRILVGPFRLEAHDGLFTGGDVTIGQSDNMSVTFDLNGFNQTAGSLTLVTAGGTKLITSALPATLTVSTSASGTFGGSIGGAVSMRKTGINALVLNGNLSYTGKSIAGGGTLQIESALPAGNALEAGPGGILMPRVAGLNVASLDIAGDGALGIRIPSATSAARVNLTGAANLSAESVLLLDLSGYPDGVTKSFIVLDAAAIPNEFGTVTVINDAGAAERVKVIYRSSGAKEQVEVVLNEGPPTETVAADAQAVFDEFSQSVVLTATVTSPSGTVNTGFMAFYISDGIANVGSGALGIVSNGQATGSFLVPAGTAAGVYTISASFSGTAEFPASRDEAHTLTVARAPVTLAADPLILPFSLAERTVEVEVTAISPKGRVDQGTVLIQIKSGAQELGAAVSGALVNGLANINYVIPGGTELGTYSIEAAYLGSQNFAAASDSSHTLTITKAVPELMWPSPGEIAFGTALSAAQLSAHANVAGVFEYTPPAGTVLPRGTHTLTADFTPTDLVRYETVTVNTTIVVGLPRPVVIWETPADIVYGTPLSDAQLNASCILAGTFTYNPPSGTILEPGFHFLRVTFVPEDSANYAQVTFDKAITVLKVPQTITFAPIADHELGEAPLELSASASSNLTVVLSVVSGSASVSGTTLTLEGAGAVTVRAEQPGNAYFDVAPAVDRTFNIVVLPPQITSALSASGTQGQPFSYTLTVSGTKPVTLSAAALPPGLSFNDASGEISGTPTASGAFQVRVTAENLAGESQITLTLVFASSGGENHPPKFTSGVLVTPNPVSVNVEIAFTASVSDEDGNNVAIVWDFGDGTQGFGATATHRYVTAGIFVAKVTITDGVASDYLNLTVVVNAAVIPPDQYKQYGVSKLGLKFNFAKPNADSLSISGTIPVPAAFLPEGKVVKFESGELEREWVLDKKATSSDKAFKLTGKFAKDGTFTGSPAKFALALKNQDLFTGLSPLGFVNDNTAKGMIVPMPVVLVIEGTGYLATVDVKYAAKKGKSGAGKK